MRMLICIMVLISFLFPNCTIAAEQRTELEARGSLIILSMPNRDGRKDPRDASGIRVQSLAVEATVANWDRDAEWDGIELRVLPRAADGSILAVNGSAAVVLIGREHVSERTTRGFPQLGTWSQPVRVHDFGGSRGAVYHLPFRESDFESNLRLLSWGTIAVTLHVARQGVFQANTPVRIRSFNPVRDALQEHQTHHDSFGRYRARHW